MKPQQTMIVKMKANLHDHCDNHSDEHCATLYNCCDIHAVIIVARVHPRCVSCSITHLVLNRLPSPFEFESQCHYQCYSTKC